MARSKNVFVMAAEEKDPFNGLLESLSLEEQTVVNGIAERVNRKVVAATGVPAPAPFIRVYGLYVIGLVLVAGLATWWLWPGAEANAAELVHDQPAEIQYSESSAMIASPSPEGQEVLPVMAVSAENHGQADVQSGVNEELPAVSIDPVDLSYDGRQSSAEQQPMSGDDEPGNSASTLNDDNGTPLEGTPDGNPADDGAAVTSTPENTDNPADEEEAFRLSVVTVKLIDKRSYLGVKAGNDGGVIRNGELGRGNNAVNRTKVMLPREMPTYPGGEQEMETFLAAQVDESLLANPDLRGQTVAVTFLVSHKGKVSDISARNGTREIAREAERIVALI